VATHLETRIRATCLGFPEVTEKRSHGAPAFFVRRQFVMLWPDGHHEHAFPHLWCAAPRGAQEALIASSEWFFRPPYVGGRGWVGIRLDGGLDWAEIAETLEDAYRAVAPQRLVARLETARPGSAERLADHLEGAVDVGVVDVEVGDQPEPVGPDT
jgi:hypothetical protein